MKKTLIAMATLAAAAAATAQTASSVTMFGVVDAGLRFGRGETSNNTALTPDGLSASQFGVRGIEDLGGGLQAGFHLEAQVHPDTGGPGAATSTNNQTAATVAGLIFNRRSTISLLGGFGELRLGRDVLPSFTNISRYDPFGTLGAGASVLQLGHATPNSVRAATGLTNSQVAVRASNSISYLTPALGGLTGHATYYLGENNTGTATSSDGRGFAVRLGWVGGPIDAGIGYGNTKYATTATMGDIKTVNVGAAYDFGVARVMANWNRDTYDTAASADVTGWTVGATAPVGAGVIRAAFSQTSLDLVGPDPRVRKLALGYVHNLSKRTAVYTTVARVKNSNGATYGLNGAVTTANSSSTGIDVGIRHSF